MNRTADGDVQQDVHTEQDVAAAETGLTYSHQLAVGARSVAEAPSSAEAETHQVVVGDIPVEPPGFRRRTGLLAELDRSRAQVSVIHPVTGLHGLGATQLAAAYARAKLEAGWRLVAWVDGADIDSLLSGLAAVADATGLTHDDSGRGVTDAAATVRHGLETDGDRCLLVFDNVSDPEELRKFVPAHGTARVLITSTQRSAANLGSAVPVDMFSAAEASAFLAGRTGLDDEAAAAEVAAALGYMPLALAVAAPVIAGQRTGYARYLDRLQATPPDASLAGDDGQAYPPSLVPAVLLALQAVRTADRTGVCTRVMELMSVLSAAGVRRELLYAAGRAGVLASGRHRIAAGSIDRVLEWLSDRSLLTFSLDGKTVILHHLVARVIRGGLDRRQRVTAVCEAAAFVLDVYSRALAGSQDRGAVRGIPQQVTALLDSLAGSVTEVEEELAWLLLRLRFVAFYHLLELGESTPQAIAVGEPLTQNLERLLGPDHPDTLNSRNSLAAAYLAAGRVSEAIPLFEQTLAVRQRMLDTDDPEMLTSQNNLASAYQDAGRTAEAIQLFELNLEARERLLGPDHPSTLNSRGNLAAAYQDAGRAAEAIPLLERTLADRERVLGPDHPDVQSSRKNLAKGYQDAGRATEAAPLLEQTLADRKRVLRPDRPGAQTSRENLADAYLEADRVADTIPTVGQTVASPKNQPPDGAAELMLPAAFRRPPADPARRVLPVGLRRPPADRARQPLPSSLTRPPAEPTHRSASRTQDASEDVQDEREVFEAITAEDPAGVAMAYDTYAAALYGYCHWMLNNSAEAAEALKNAFIVATATLIDLSEPAKLRPWLFALARNECRRRIRPTSGARDEEVDAVGQPIDVSLEVSDATREASDATMTFRAISEPSNVGGELSDVVREASDATMTFRAISEPSNVGGELSDVVREASDATMTFRAIGEPSEETREPFDATLSFPVISLPHDATMPFRVVSLPPSSLARVNGDREAELRTLTHAILAGLTPREREVIELSFRHDLYDDRLAIALGMSSSRVHALASRARGRLEEALSALHIALTRREACAVLGKLLTDWDGQLTEETRELVVWHIQECQTCAHHGWGALRPVAFSRLLPLAPLPPELREQVLSGCISAAEDAMAYRRRVVRRAESIWFTKSSSAIRHLSWASIRAHPGAAIATVAVAMWFVAAVSITLLTFTGSHAVSAQAAKPAGRSSVHAYATQTTAGTSLGSPVVGPATSTAPASAAARPSPALTKPPVYVSPVKPSLSAPPKPSRSASPKPSRSASPKPSKSASHTPSPSPSPSHTPSPSPSPSSSPSPSP